jgi:hypothetical protein
MIAPDKLIDIHAKLQRDEGWNTRTEEERQEIAACLRDLFFAHAEESLDKKQQRLFLEAIDQTEPQLQICLQDIHICYHPSRSAKLLRFIDTAQIPVEHRDLFVSPEGVMNHLSAVFVDPLEFNYTNFENIIPIDRLAQHKALNFSFGDHTAHRADIHSFHMSGSKDAIDLIESLDGLGLYLKPLETNARGGSRCLLLSTKLSDALTEGLKEALPEELREGFSHVNPVFRCNRFTPADEPFHSHVDTPYYDPNNGHVSRYTLLIYMTGGKAESVLEVDGVNFEEMPEMTAVLFHQNLEHSGAPFVEGDKIFLRSELVFEFKEEEMESDPRIASLFSRACYMDRQSLFHPELSAQMQDAYDSVARAHWEGLPEDHQDDALYMHKKYGGVSYLSNGCDYWFSSVTDLKECALLATLDYFNGFFTQPRKSFEKLCKAKAVKDRPGTDWIPEFLEKQDSSAHIEDAYFPNKHLVPAHKHQSSRYTDSISFSYTAEAFGEYYEDTDILDVTSKETYGNYKIQSAMDEAVKFVTERIEASPFLLVGKEIFLDPEKVVVTDDRIFVTSDTKLDTFNFASDVWNEQKCLAGNFIGIDTIVHGSFLLLPPILWEELDGCYHLKLDLFQNDWMVSSEEREIPLPKLIERRSKRNKTLPESAMPWYNAVKDEISFKNHYSNPFKSPKV